MKRKDALWVMQMCRDRDARSEAEREAFDTAIDALKSESIFTADRPRPIDPTCAVDPESGVVPRSAVTINDITKWRTWSHTYDNACMDEERSEDE